MITLQKTYRKRPIRFLELWQPGDWNIKVYSIAYPGKLARSSVIHSAKKSF